MSLRNPAVGLALFTLLATLFLVGSCRTSPNDPSPALAVATSDDEETDSVPSPTEAPAEEESQPQLAPEDTNRQPALWTYRVVNAYPHDPDAFTQGLVYVDGLLLEGTGLRGRSTLRRVVLETGDVVQSIALDDRFFGEGVTLFDDRIYQLTWQSGVGFIYDADSFDALGGFAYGTEGWGLTHDGVHLIMSDGTPTLRFLDPATMQEVASVQVHDASGPIFNINELEYIDGEVFANIWQTDDIARIDPQSGRVLGWINLSGLLPEADRRGSEDVLNGIAYDADAGRLFVTGKLWPKLYEIELVAAE